MNEAPKAREPGVTLETIIKRLRSHPRTVELELALQDFLELPQVEQMEILFLSVAYDAVRIDWLVEAVQNHKGQS